MPIFNPHNLGVTENCNIALNNCHGEYLALFAGDDIMLPGKISKQVSFMEANPDCVLCYHPVEIFDSGSGKTLFVTNQHRREDVNSTEDLLLKGGIPGGCSIMIRRSALPLGGYDPRLKTVSDWLFFLEVSMKGKVCKIDEVLARYRKHAGGASNQTYALLAESLHALDIFEQKQIGVTSLSPVILRAKARYIAGEAFRQIIIDPQLAITLAANALLYERNTKYMVLYIIAYANKSLPGVNKLLRYCIKRFKYLFKRLVG
jgi:glycosyltransferase involved in cell wall biosynthesis